MLFKIELQFLLMTLDTPHIILHIFFSGGLYKQYFFYTKLPRNQKSLLALFNTC